MSADTRETLPGTTIPAVQTLRSATARPLALACAVIVVIAAASLFFQMPPLDALALAGVPLAFGALVGLLFYLPRVELSPAGLRIVNIFSTVDLPWPAIDSFDVRFGLGVNTRWDKRYSAWALPGSRRRPEKREGQARRVIESHPAPQVQAVLDYFAALASAGALQDPRFPDAPARSVPDWRLIAGAVLAVAWGILGVVSL